MSEGRTTATIVLVDSEDVRESIGRRGFLVDHLRPMGDTDVQVKVMPVRSARCDIIARRIDGGQAPVDTVPPGLDTWCHEMIDPVEIPDSASLFVLSLADAVNAEVFRHRVTGVLVQPPIGFRESWTDGASTWLHENFDPDPPTVDNITDGLRSIARQLDSYAADLVVLNTSTFVPNEKVYWFNAGDPDTTSVRAARMNLVVDTLVKDLDITLVDVDRITAELGARQAVVGPARYSRETFNALAEEAITMILDLEGISTMFASDAMQLSVPRYDRRTSAATLVRWHVTPDAEIARGDVLFDLRFGNVTAKLDDHGRETDRAIDMSVVAGRGGFVDSISAEPGTELTVGSRVGVITARRGTSWHDIENAARFPVGVRILGRDDR